MAMNAVSFFLRRTRSSQKDAARLQKLLSCLSVCGGRQRENFFWVCVFWVFFVLVKNLRVGPDPDKSDGRFFFILLRERSA